MSDLPVEKLVKIGMSEYEAKAYLALLGESPVTGYQLAKSSGVPRSMIYEVMGKLVARGAAMTLPTGSSVKYAAVPADEFLDQLQREHEALIGSLREPLERLSAVPDLDYVWNLEGLDSVTAKATEMINQANREIYLALRPDSFPALKAALEEAVSRGVRVVVYSTDGLDLSGAQVVVAHVSEETLGQAGGLGLILVIDGEEVLVGEWLKEAQARASWTSSPLLVFIAEHHLRTDLYLPQLLAMVGTEGLDFIQEADRELFARALESHIR